MFTGLIEEIGIVKSIEFGQKSASLTIGAEKVLQDTKIGDSISTNGICLTVVAKTQTSFMADVMAETIRSSSLGSVKPGDKVNLERALTLKDRLGGHMVSGHIDGTGKITAYKREENAIWITVETKSSILKYIIRKGSVALDGVSLTVAEVDDKCFKVSIIPTTSKDTTLTKKIAGAKVNIECDITAKYIEKLMKFNNEEKRETINLDFLKENGFV